MAQCEGAETQEHLPVEEAQNLAGYTALPTCSCRSSAGKMGPLPAWCLFRQGKSRDLPSIRCA